MEKNLVSKNIVIGKRNNRTQDNGVEQINIFNEINLYDIFGNEEVERLMKESAFINCRVIDEKEEDLYSSYYSGDTDIIVNEESKRHKKKPLKMFDRMALILKFLQTAIDKLNKYKENTVAKGLEW